MDLSARTSSEAFSKFACALQFSQLPSEISDLCKSILLDTIGVTIAAGGIISASRLLTSYAARAFGMGETTIWGYPQSTTPMGAAFANGGLSHALNFDTLDAGYAGLIPAAVLAAADCNERTSGQEALTAIAVGVELLTRIQDAASHGTHSYNGMLNGQLQTYFGCAAAAAKVMGLSTEQIDSTLGLALMQAAGSMQITLDGDPDAKAFYGAFPNQAGLQSALLAREGLQASCDALSGNAGLLRLFYGSEIANDDIFCDLGEDYRLRRARFKKWPTSAAFAELIVAALDIKTNARLKPEEVQGIEIVTNPTMRIWFEPHKIRRAPPNAAAAGNSAPFAIAVALTKGTFTLSDLTERGLRQALVLRLASRIEAQFDRPVGQPTELALTVRDGQTFRRSIDPTFHSAIPWLGQNDIREKFSACIRYASEQSIALREHEIVHVIEHLEEVPNCRSLTQLLSGGTH